MHAPLAPSSAPVWAFCAGSVQMQAMYPQESTDDSRAGDAAHWVCSSVQEVRVSGDTVAGVPNCGLSPNDYINMQDPAGTVITEEMARAAEVFTSYNLGIAEAAGVLQDMKVEKLVQCPSVHPSACFGTPDFRLYVPSTNTLHVNDFKFGHGYVDEFENLQNVTYLSGILDDMGVDGHGDQDLNVELAITQPRYYHASPVRVWKIKASDIRGLVNMLKYQGQKALMSDAECVSGPHCRNCTARLNCDAARQSGYWAMQVSAQPMPINISPAAVGTELMYIKRAIRALEYMESAHLEHIESLLDSNVVVPGFAKMPSKGQRKWKLDDATMVAVGNACGYDLRSSETVTPAAAERLGVDAEFVKQQTYSPTKMKVKAVKDSTIKKVFS